MILDASLSRNPYAAMFRKDDPPSRLWSTARSPDVLFGPHGRALQDLVRVAHPPKNANLNFPMNAYTKELFASPNDKGI